MQLDLEGHTLNAEVWQQPDAISIRILPRQNNPTVERRFKDRLTDSNADPPEISVDLKGGYKQRVADSGYLRAAYLGAFAKFGYRWILTAEMDPIRRQILNPADAVIQNYRIGFGDKMDAMTDGFYLMKQPITALLVRIGKFGILLPWPGMSDAIQISNWIEDEKKKGLSGTQTFAILGRWPITCEFILDGVAKGNS